MPTLQLSKQEVNLFEHHFCAAVAVRVGKPICSTEQAYKNYQQMDEHKRQKFWEYMSNNTGLNRDRVYKFFRFTWSRQFYTQIDPYREEIKSLILELLDQIGATKKPDGINQHIWTQVWQRYSDMGFHYDGTDQFVRNCVNLYYHKASQLPESQQVSVPPIISKKDYSRKNDQTLHQTIKEEQTQNDSLLCNSCTQAFSRENSVSEDLFMLGRDYFMLERFNFHQLMRNEVNEIEMDSEDEIGDPCLIRKQRLFDKEYSKSAFTIDQFLKEQGNGSLEDVYFDIEQLRYENQ